MKWFLREFIEKGIAMPPAFVVEFERSSELREHNPRFKKAIFDGTHKAVLSTLTGAPLFVIEMDMDKILLAKE